VLNELKRMARRVSAFDVSSLAGGPQPSLRGTWAGRELNATSDAAASSGVLETMRWALAIVQSRAMTMHRPGKSGHPLSDTPFLAPGADLMDHRHAAPVGWRFDEEAGEFQILATATAQPGAHLFNDYGPLSSARAAARYGFVPAGGFDDAVPLTLDAPLHEGTAGAACAGVLRLNETHTLTRRGLTPSILNAARVLVLGMRLQTRAEFRLLAALNGAAAGHALLGASDEEAADQRPAGAEHLATEAEAREACGAVARAVGDLGSANASTLRVPPEVEAAALAEVHSALGALAGVVEAERRAVTRGRLDHGPATAAARRFPQHHHEASRQGRVRPRRKVGARAPAPATSAPASEGADDSCFPLDQALDAELALLRTAQAQASALMASLAPFAPPPLPLRPSPPDERPEADGRRMEVGADGEAWA